MSARSQNRTATSMSYKQRPGRANRSEGFCVLNSYLSGQNLYCVNFSVFAVDARCGDVNFHRGAPSRGLEWAGFEAASATGPAGRHTVHFPQTLPFSKPILRMTPIYVIFDISRWREYYASRVGCYWTSSSRRWYSDQFRCKILESRLDMTKRARKTLNYENWNVKMTSLHVIYHISR